MSNPKAIPSVSVTYAQDSASTRSNALGLRPMQERLVMERINCWKAALYGYPQLD